MIEAMFETLGQVVQNILGAEINSGLVLIIIMGMLVAYFIGRAVTNEMGNLINVIESSLKNTAAHQHEIAEVQRDQTAALNESTLALRQVLSSTQRNEQMMAETVSLLTKINLEGRAAHEQIREGRDAAVAANEKLDRLPSQVRDELMTVMDPILGEVRALKSEVTTAAGVSQTLIEKATRLENTFYAQMNMLLTALMRVRETTSTTPSQGVTLND